MNEPNGWSRAEMMVLSKLDELQESVDRLEEAVILVRIDVAKLKVKSGLWGAVAGTIPAAIGIILVIVTGSGNA